MFIWSPCNFHHALSQPGQNSAIFSLVRRVLTLIVSITRDFLTQIIVVVHGVKGMQPLYFSYPLSLPLSLSLSHSSTGRRLCMGETLAKAELFLFTVHLLHRYNIAPEDPNSPPSFDSIDGLTRAPVPHKIRFIKREV